MLFVTLLMVFYVHAQDLKIGSDLPKFELNSSIYGSVTSADLKNKVVLVSLFATWCAPCQKELADIQSTLWPTYKDNKDFVLLVIGREHTDADLQKYNERKKFAFPLYPDSTRKVFSLFAEKSIPRTYLFGKNGKLVYSSVGYTADDFLKLMEKIKEIL